MRRVIIYISIISLIISLIILSGCTSKSLPVKTYLINPDLNLKQVHSIYANKTVKVAYPSSTKGKSSSEIYFAYNKIEESSYQDSSWSSSSSELLSSSIIRALEMARVFKSAVDYRSTATTDYLLESSVYDIYHKVRKDESLSILTIRFNLIDSSSNLLIKSKKFSYQIPTDSVDALGYVKATNKATKQLSKDLVKWLSI